jgi:uncharacterized protein
MEKETKVRLPVLDGLRGYFILWIGIFNTLSILQVLSSNVYIAGILLLINDKGWFCLCGIFGYSFGLLLQSEEGLKVFLKRMVLLFLLGVINSFLFYGDILKDYALIGLLLYSLQNPIKRHPHVSLGLVSVLMLLSLYWIDSDMAKAGNFAQILKAKGWLAPITYNLQLYIQSKYFLICYHLEMFWLVLIGYLASQLGIKKLVFWICSSVPKNLQLYLFLDVIIIGIWLMNTTNKLGNYGYLFHILFFSFWYMLGLVQVMSKLPKLGSFFAEMGKCTLSLYLCQNVILYLMILLTLECSKMIDILFLGLQMGLIVWFRFDKRFLGSRFVEKYWRALALRKWS